MSFFDKQVNDPVHGVIGLSKLEMELISSRAFQRLHHIKQLGLGALVYPGANYSRFSHSLGACFIAGQMLEAIARNTRKPFTDREVQLYRLGGLLHDIGHYPYSHTFEHVIENYYKDKIFLGESAPENQERFPTGEPAVYDHELMGRKLIEGDDELKEIFERYGFTPNEVRAVFTAEQPGSLSTLISSDLDCDRLDYLMRTALHAGLPYGRVDVPYIISQMTLDSTGKPCLNRKAIKAADHFLVSRYFDYSQLPFHKTVAGLEIALEHILEGLLNRNKLDCSSGSMLKMITNKAWYDFDDQQLMNLFQKEIRDENSKNDKIYYASLRSVLLRMPPKLVFSADCIEDREWSKNHRSLVRNVETQIPKWASECSIDWSLWNIWSVPLSITKMGATARADRGMNAEQAAKDEELRSQLIWIKGLDPQNPDVARPITLAPDTLVRTLSDKQFFGLRVYVNLSSFVGDFVEKLTQIRNVVQRDMNGFT